MPIVKIVTCEDEKMFCWCTTNDLKTYINFIQYIIDNYNNSIEFQIVDIDNKKVYNMYEVATKHYKMKKRNFNERINDIKTGIFSDIL